jgi:hypothetical protein
MDLFGFITGLDFTGHRVDTNGKMTTILTCPCMAVAVVPLRMTSPGFLLIRLDPSWERALIDREFQTRRRTE